MEESEASIQGGKNSAKTFNEYKRLCVGSCQSLEVLYAENIRKFAFIQCLLYMKKVTV